MFSISGAKIEDKTKRRVDSKTLHITNLIQQNLHAQSYTPDNSHQLIWPPQHSERPQINTLRHLLLLRCTAFTQLHTRVLARRVIKRSRASARGYNCGRPNYRVHSSSSPPVYKHTLSLSRAKFISDHSFFSAYGLRQSADDAYGIEVPEAVKYIRRRVAPVAGARVPVSGVLYISM